MKTDSVIPIPRVDIDVFKAQLNMIGVRVDKVAEKREVDLTCGYVDVHESALQQLAHEAELLAMRARGVLRRARESRADKRRDEKAARRNRRHMEAV